VKRARRRVPDRCGKRTPPPTTPTSTLGDSNADRRRGRGQDDYRRPAHRPLAGDGLAPGLRDAPDVGTGPAADVQHVVGPRCDFGFAGPAGLTQARREGTRGSYGTGRDGKWRGATEDPPGLCLGGSTISEIGLNELLPIVSLGAATAWKMSRRASLGLLFAQFRGAYAPPVTCSACPLCGSNDPKTTHHIAELVCRCKACGAVWRVTRLPDMGQ